MVPPVGPRYKTLQEVGRGGMGIVYKAEDLKLHRIVALKFLPEDLTAQGEDIARFEREAEAISSLNHPNIATIYDVDEVEGRKFLTLEFISGGTLKSKVKQLHSEGKEIPISEVVEYGIQIADGLAYAHRHGIVHRDIKSDNVMMTDEGKVKITDFGLAKLHGTIHVTRTGSTVGTLGYIAPEQLRGEDIDHRADLFSFGVVMYEMVALRLPFRGEHEAALTYSIANEDPVSVRTLKKELPLELDRIIMKCLQKDRMSRYQNAEEIAADLRGLQQKAASPETPGSRVRRTRLSWIVVAAITVIGAVGIIMFLPTSHITEANSKTIAVLPFANMNGNPEEEFFSDGMTEDILTQLSKIADLSVISRTSVMQYKATKKNIHEIGRELNAGVILEGSVRRAGDQVRIVAQLIDVKSDKHLWADTYDREYKQVFAIQSEIAQKIASSLQAKLSMAEKERLSNPSTTNVEAYNAYLQGRYFVDLQTKEDLEKAVGCFERVMKLDPNYARAWAGMATAHRSQADEGYVPVEDGYAKARKEIEKALELDPNLAEAHAIIGGMKRHYDWDWPGAEASLKRALDLDPGNTTAMLGLAELNADLGRFDEAITLYRKAITLDPLRTGAYIELSDITYCVGRLEEAEGAASKGLLLNPHYPWAHEMLGEIYLGQSKLEEAIAEMQRETNDGYRFEGLALVYHAMRKIKEADSALTEFIKGYQDVDAYQIAEVFSYRGESDKAFEWLDRAYTQRDPGLVFLKIDPLLVDIRKDPRYMKLMKKMKLPL
ncbi:MAG TPA: protein kinase [Bacteroidota bacterium]|nr:protein kinase [Bacteroidota bacterium]